MIDLLSNRLGPLRNADSDASLDFFPSELTILEVILVIFVFVGRQVLHLLRLDNLFQIKTVSGQNEEIYELPELSVSMPFRLTEEDLKKYSAAVGSGTEAHQNLANLLDQAAQKCLLLSAFSEPAMLLLLSHHKSPIRPLGAVNVTNRFEVLRHDICSVEVLLKAKFAVVATFVRQARKVKRGLEIDVVVEIVSFDEDVVFRQVFTMLQFMTFKTKPSAPAQKADELSADMFARGESRAFGMSAGSPRKWAAICKDYNPIHMSALTAKMFGFRSTIAHGNHTLAIALRRLENYDDISVYTEDKPFSMEVHFRRPIVLPATLRALGLQGEDRQYDVCVEQSGKICLSASLKRG